MRRLSKVRPISTTPVASSATLSLRPDAVVPCSTASATRSPVFGLMVALGPRTVTGLATVKAPG
ncbi:MAG: hypothetical protein BWX70_02547 [Verrucomicrobia bacterium ADurb.Bin070]|nr:MAG: hypothetical protein BWX70_02547 [Verrucomicrobia bacterium ADurb.Bin070]